MYIRNFCSVKHIPAPCCLLSPSPWWSCSGTLGGLLNGKAIAKMVEDGEWLGRPVTLCTLAVAVAARYQNSMAWTGAVSDKDLVIHGASIPCKSLILMRVYPRTDCGKWLTRCSRHAESCWFHSNPLANSSFIPESICQKGCSSSLPFLHVKASSGIRSASCIWCDLHGMTWMTRSTGRTLHVKMWLAWQEKNTCSVWRTLRVKMWPVWICMVCHEMDYMSRRHDMCCAIRHVDMWWWLLPRTDLSRLSMVKFGYGRLSMDANHQFVDSCLG